MNSKTPQFDTLLDEILNTLVPHMRVCKYSGVHPHCEGNFEITSEDIEFLTMLRVPPPNYCPTCRRMRRLVHMNMTRLFKRECSVPGHTETMISIFPSECPFPVYDYQYFIGDEFDAFSFTKKYEQGESPMEKLFNLRKEFPMPSFLNRDPSCINSEYTNGGRDNKNCYFAMGCYTAEDVWYSNLVNKSRNVMDSRAVNNSEFVYDSLYSDRLYKTSSAYFSDSCTDSMFLFDCRNCTNCFGCVNLRNSKYCIFNEQYSKESYEEFMKSIKPFSHEVMKECKEKFWTLVKKLPMNAAHNIGSSNVSGVSVTKSSNLFDVVDADNSEHSRHCDGLLSHKDSMDLLFSGGNSHHLYGTVNIGSLSSGVRFSVSSKFCTDCEFVFNSKNLNNCFMCFGLQNKSYCILNTQYSPEEYWPMVDKIKAEMLKRGEYNDGLGFEFSAQAYNFSMAQVSYPLSDDLIIKLGAYTAKEPETNVGSLEVLTQSELPSTMDKVTDEIINKAISCEISGRAFRVIQTELNFYRSMGLPLPTVHPVLRMEEKFRMAPNGRKYKSVCAKCERDINSLFDPKENYTLYCEKCYQQEVI